MTWLLLRIRIRAFFSSLLQGRSKKKKGVGGKIVMGLLMLYVFGVLLFSFGMLFSSLLPLCAAGLRWLYFAVMGAMAFALSFLLTVFSAQSTLFAAKDNQLLLSMPIPARAILGSRMGLLLFLCYFYQTLVILPAFFQYARAGYASVGNAVCFVIACLLLPFFVLTLSCLFAWGLHWLSGRVRQKNLITTVASLVFLGGYMLVYWRMNRYIAALVENAAVVGETLRQSVWPLYAFGRAVVGSPLYLLLFALCALIPFGLVLFALGRNFGRLSATGNARVRRYREKAQRARRPIPALIGKELCRFKSSPMYMMNAGLGLVFAVALGAAFLIKGPSLLALVDIPADLPVPLMLTLGLSLCTAMNFISAPSISLEGENLWIAKVLPLAPGAVLEAKALAHVVLCAGAGLLAGFLCCAGLMRAGTSASILEIAGLFLAPLAFGCFCGYLGVVINLQFPKFDWVSETQAVKQSLSTMVAMFGSIALVVGAMFLYMALPLPAAAYTLCCAGLFLLLTLLLRAYLYSGRAAEKWIAL